VVELVWCQPRSGQPDDWFQRWPSSFRSSPAWRR